MIVDHPTLPRCLHPFLPAGRNKTGKNFRKIEIITISLPRSGERTYEFVLSGVLIKRRCCRRERPGREKDETETIGLK
jgi:hypothetical protein